MRRLLIFAQTPPPLHGQSLMAAELLEGLRETGQEDVAEGSGPREVHGSVLAYYHVNPQISEDLRDIGRWRVRKLLLVFRYVLEAVRARFVHGLTDFYFVPAPAKRTAMYRDWAVLFLCRPFYANLILHWHCVGQPEFIEQKMNGVEKFLARLAYGWASLSICLSNYSREEAAYFTPRRTVVVPNGIPDPCPLFDEQMWPGRQRRAQALRKLISGETSEPILYEVLFLSGRMTEKGLFDAMAAVAAANQELGRQGRPLRLRLTVAGIFADAVEHGRFEAGAREIQVAAGAGSWPTLVVEAGWADEEAKGRLYGAADCFLFPTTYPAESFGLVLTEAMAHGCAVVATRWQGVPEVLPAGYPYLTEPHDVAGMAATLLQCAAQPADRSLRDYFLARFTRERFRSEMLEVLSWS